ncbi:MAG TPA: hypothetical protein VKY85_10880 [Candidatus Angelobacter sp.]|nr:hypothetical protein [Candidatus Angelobacter sp.]
MKRVLMGTLLIGVMGMGTALAQDGWGDRYRDRQDIRRDQAKIEHDRWELRRDLREGNYAAAAHERAEIRSRYRDLNHDRRDLYWDRR